MKNNEWISVKDALPAYLQMNESNYKDIIQTELIYYVGDSQGFQNDINEFAKHHHVIDIKYHALVVGTRYGDRVMDRALITYKVKKEEKKDE